MKKVYVPHGQRGKKNVVCVWEVYFQLSKEDGCNN